MSTERADVLISLEQKEVALVRALLETPGLLDGRGEAAVRTALSLSRLHLVRVDGADVDVEPLVLGLRDETLKLLAVAGVKEGSTPSPEKLRPVATILREHALRTTAHLYQAYAGRVPREVLDREVRQRRLVVAAGGGGGVGYVYLGAFQLLEECGLRPALIAGTSMGAIMGLVRARGYRFDTGEILNVLRGLSWPKLFHLLSMQSRYGLPAALRLYLRASMGRYFEREDGTSLTLADLPIPFVAAVTGLRASVLPRPLEFYERLLGDTLTLPTPFRIARRIPAIVAALAELVAISERLEAVHLGLDPGTEAFDAVDAVGFSAALPGVIHYDVVRQDDRMHALLRQLFEARDIFRLADGGIVDNVPARAAWDAVQAGRIGTRHAFVLALDAFAPRLTTPVWLPVQQLVARQVQRSCACAHLYQPFTSTLSPLDVVPGVGALVKMMERGKRDLSAELPFLTRMMQPLPALDA